MATISGINGSINGKSVVRRWKINHSGNPVSFVTRGTGRVIGNTDWSGSYDAYGHTPEAMPGDTFAFVGGIGVPTTDKGATGTGIVESVEIRWNIETGALIEHTVNFAANGSLVFGTVTPTPGTTLNLFKSIGCILKIALAPAAPAELTGIQTMTLRLRRTLHPYASSETAGIIKRVIGQVDADASFTCYCADFSTLPAAGTMQWVQMYVNATIYWEIKSMIVREDSDMGPDMESGGPVSVPVNLDFSAYYENPAGTFLPGTIKNPAAATWWP